MKIYLVNGFEMLISDGKVQEDECCNSTFKVCSSLDVAIEYLEVNGFKNDNRYEVKSSLCGGSSRVSDVYWYDYIDGLVNCSWVEEHEVIEKIDYVFDDNLNVFYKKCCNCEHVIYDFDGYGYCNCKDRNNFHCNSDNCKHFNLSDDAEMYYDLFVY